MSDQIRQARSKVAALEKELKDKQEALESARRALQYAEAQCCGGRHSWGEAEYKPIYHEGYTIPGDPPGTMGIDWRGPCHVPSSSEPRWIRTCKACGKVEETKQAREETVKKPDWR
jgi:hypothetical protein